MPIPLNNLNDSKSYHYLLQKNNQPCLHSVIEDKF